jgi:electron transport complex protein RnfB
MFDAIIIFSVLSLILGLVLGYAAIKFKIDGNPLVDQIDALLPQTQCGQCDFAGCRPYAEAIAKGEAQINQCPPGGQEGVDALAELLDVETLQLNEAFGENTTEHVVYVDEQVCIGCTLCIQACPVDEQRCLLWWGNLLNFWFFYWVWIRNMHPTFKGITSHDLSPLNLEHSCPKLFPNP